MTKASLNNLKIAEAHLLVHGKQKLGSTTTQLVKLNTHLILLHLLSHAFAFTQQQLMMLRKLQFQ